MLYNCLTVLTLTEVVWFCLEKNSWSEYLIQSFFSGHKYLVTYASNAIQLPDCKNAGVAKGQLRLSPGPSLGERVVEKHRQLRTD